MPLIIPPGFANVSVPFRHSQVTRTAFVVFGVEITASVATPDELADRIFGDIAPIRGRVDNDVTIGPVRVAVGQDGGEPVIGFGTATSAGGRTMSSVTPAIAHLVNKRSGRGGRRGRGFMYLPWAVNEGEVNEAGIINSAANGLMQTALNTTFDNLDGPNPMVLLHNSEGNTPAGDPTPVTSLVANAVVSTQRRRQTR